MVIVGTGNVAKHLFDAFLASNNVKVDQVLGRNKNRLKHFEKHTKTSTDFENVYPSDILLLAVSDDAINELSIKFKNSDALVAHTSGSFDIEVISSQRKGVFYPLQTFTEGKKIDFDPIPICIEAGQEPDLKLLGQLAKSLSNQVFEISSEQRKSLHLAAVFVNNFTNHLYQIGKEICEENNVPFNILRPLIRETANKIATISPKEAQTGPARRNDIKTLHAQLSLLKKSEHRELYKIMTNTIKAAYGKEL